MVIEILFPEVCSLYGDSQNITYLQATAPDATFVMTSLVDSPYFAENTPDLLYIGSMSESIQRRVLEKLMPLKSRLEALIAGGTPILATGNAAELFTKRIDYVTEELTAEGLGIFDLTVKTNLFDRFNGKVLSEIAGMKLTGFRSQFSMIYGDNSDCYFAKVLRGIGINRDSKLEGMRKNNLLCTHLLGPILPLNPLFCEYVMGLTGQQLPAAFREAAMDAYEQRLKEFEDPSVVFGRGI